MSQPVPVSVRAGSGVHDSREIPDFTIKGASVRRDGTCGEPGEAGRIRRLAQKLPYFTIEIVMPNWEEDRPDKSPIRIVACAKAKGIDPELPASVGPCRHG